jgi:hypothetical protein
VLDAADQVAEGGMQLLDDRSAWRLTLGNKKVDLLAVKRTSGLHISRFGLSVLALANEDRNVVDKIGPDHLDVLDNPRDVAEGCLRLLDQVIDGIFRSVAIELPNAIASLFFPTGESGE